MKINKEQIINGLIVGVVAGITMFLLSGLLMAASMIMHDRDGGKSWKGDRMMHEYRDAEMDYDNKDPFATYEAGTVIDVSPEEAAAR